ncbi:AI-2E family transporter [Saliphagus infecundisoli]|uniref:AI-2E family transporter n=1 Tax=Saliphagus infecundisoli TaxID=1849069 RepID=A0ABD5QDC0_9EURY|nr:AI-2E family transporter [Saliphagus infecundisoli]
MVARAGRSERTALGIFALTSVALAVAVVLPYVQYVLLGALLAYVLAPAQRSLESHVGSTTAAVGLISAVVVVLILPVVYVLVVAIRQASGLLGAVQQQGFDPTAIERQLEGSGYRIDPDVLRTAVADYEEEIGTGIQGLVTGVFDVVGGIPAIVFGLTVTVFVLFSLLRDGDRLMGWLREVAPVRPAVQAELLAELDRLMWASVVGNVAVSAIQAIALGVGLWALSVPGVVFLTVVTFVLALLPLIGAFGVWVPVSVYLLVIGRPGAAAALVVYGSLVSASDTYLRPALIGRSGPLSAAVIVVGIFGGVSVFGAVGLFVGPVVVGAAKVGIDLYARYGLEGLGTPAPDDP